MPSAFRKLPLQSELARVREQIGWMTERLFVLGMQLQRELSPGGAEQVSLLVAQLRRMKEAERDLEFAAEQQAQVSRGISSGQT